MQSLPKLVAFDLDGTLAQSKQRVSADMGELLTKLLRKVPVAVLSGASFAQFETQLLPALGEDARLENLYLFPTNAAACFVYRRGSWHPEYDHAFSDTDRARIHEAIAQALAEEQVEEPAQLWGPQVQDRGAQITFSAVGQAAPVAAKRAWGALHEQKRKRLRDLLAQKLPGYSVATGGITSVDITRKGINKAHGMRRLAELTGVSVSEMIYVGDALGEGGNDAVVKETGVRTHEVFGPEESAALIQTLLARIRG